MDHTTTVWGPFVMHLAQAALRHLAGPRWLTGLVASRVHEVCDHLTQLTPSVLLQEVPSTRDDRVAQTLRTGDVPLEDRPHRRGDEVAVAEGD